MSKEVDAVVTHGPPSGIMDYIVFKQRAGCSDLFAAIARSRPPMHCFGHIHEGWGAKIISWRDKISESPSHFTDIDNRRSFVVENLSGLRESNLDTPEDSDQKVKNMNLYQLDRCCTTSHCTGDTNALKHGEQTLFVNAAVQGTEDDPWQLPWLIDLELPRSG